MGPWVHQMRYWLMHFTNDIETICANEFLQRSFCNSGISIYCLHKHFPCISCYPADVYLRKTYCLHSSWIHPSCYLLRSSLKPAPIHRIFSLLLILNCWQNWNSLFHWIPCSTPYTWQNWFFMASTIAPLVLFIDITTGVLAFGVLVEAICDCKLHHSGSLLSSSYSSWVTSLITPTEFWMLSHIP